MGESLCEFSEEAVDLALEWAYGHRSYLNQMLSVESSVADRPRTLAATAEADAAEVVKWAALAAILPSREARGV